MMITDIAISLWKVRKTMQTKICDNCGRLHFVDGKRLFIDGKLQPLKCQCINPQVMSVESWIDKYSSTLYDATFIRCLRAFIIKHKMYEFAFKCANEPYCEQYSDRIKNAIVETTSIFDRRKLTEIFENDLNLFKEFYLVFKMTWKKEKFKEA